RRRSAVRLAPSRLLILGTRRICAGGENLIEHLRVQGPGGDGIDVDACTAKLRRKRFGEPYQPALGGGIRAEPRARAGSAATRHVDDLAVLPRPHDRKHQTTEVYRREQID